MVYGGIYYLLLYGIKNLMDYFEPELILATNKVSPLLLLLGAIRCTTIA